MFGRATFTMVASSTTMSWAVRMTKRNTEGWARRPRRVPGWPSEGLAAAAGRGFERVRGIDDDLSAAILSKRKLPPVSIRRGPPFSKFVVSRGMKRMVDQGSVAVVPADEPGPKQPDGAARPKRADARRNRELL